MDKRMTKFRFEQAAQGVQRLYVYDDVTAYGSFNWETWEYDESETSAKFFRDRLAEIPDTDIIELHVNSYGGDVKEGIAIYNQLKQHKAKKICYVDGFAYSIASIICMACEKIIMGLGTSMLIHNMAAYTYGNAEQLRKMADDLDVLMESNRKIYMARARNLTEDELAEMMDKETYLTPEQCLEYGFCDEIDGESAAGTDPQRVLEEQKKIIMELRRELHGQQSFREELRRLGEGASPTQTGAAETNNGKPQGNTLPPSGEEKVLKMVSAFFNAFNKKER